MEPTAPSILLEAQVLLWFHCGDRGVDRELTAVPAWSDPKLKTETAAILPAGD